MQIFAKFGLLFILTILSYQVGCDKIGNGKWKTYFKSEGHVKFFDSSKSRLEWNLKFVPQVDWINWSGISFHLWNLSLYNCLIHEHLRFMSTFVSPPSFSKRVAQSLMFVSRSQFVSNEGICIYFCNLWFVIYVYHQLNILRMKLLMLDI